MVRECMPWNSVLKNGFVDKNVEDEVEASKIWIFYFVSGGPASETAYVYSSTSLMFTHYIELKNSGNANAMDTMIHV